MLITGGNNPFTRPSVFPIYETGSTVIISTDTWVLQTEVTGRLIRCPFISIKHNMEKPGFVRMDL